MYSFKFLSFALAFFEPKKTRSVERVEEQLAIFRAELFLLNQIITVYLMLLVLLNNLFVSKLSVRLLLAKSYFCALKLSAS
jgi:hypothetical protein